MDPDWIRIRIGIQPKMLDPDPYQMNADPQPCIAGKVLASVIDEHPWTVPGGQDATGG